jgi:hypothetical protein
MSGIDLDDVPNWRGRDVIDQHGHPVGVLTDIFVDDATGLPEWGVVKTGLFSHRVTFVPLSQARSHGMRVQLPYAQAQIHDAPNIEPHGQLSADEEARLYAYYGLDYDQTGTSGAESGYLASETDTTGAARQPRLRRHEAPDQDPGRAPGE